MSLLKTAFFATLAITLLALLLPAADVLATKVWLASWLPGAHWVDQADLTQHGDKWTHAGLFLALGWLAMRAWQSRQHRQGWADALGLALGAVLGWRLKRSQIQVQPTITPWSVK